MAILQKVYPTTDRETKERILEGIGRVGSMQSIPFLVDALDEPFQNLRIIAAAALIQCLNH
jgi:HEAT repeat protein